MLVIVTSLLNVETPDTDKLSNSGVSVNVIVAPAPDAVAVKLLLTKFISPTLPTVPTVEPSLYSKSSFKAPTCPALIPVKLEPSP